MDKKTVFIRKFIMPLFVCVLFVPLLASAGGQGGMTTGGHSGQTMTYGYGLFPSSSVNQAAWNMGSLGLYAGIPFSPLGYGSVYSSYQDTSRFGSFLSPSYGMYYGSAFGGFSPGYGFGYSWGGPMGGGSMRGGSMGGSEDDYGSLTFSSAGYGASSGSDRTAAYYSGQQFYSPFSLLNPLMYGFFVGWI